MKKIIALAFMLGCVPGFAADSTPTPIAPRISLFSTTVDWHGVTGLSLSQYTGKFTGTNRSLVKNGLVLYYLDSFPCYGEADSVRVWISPNDPDKNQGTLRLVCITPPQEVKFAWHNAAPDAIQSETTGLLICPVSGDYELKIDLSKCYKGPNWSEYK